MCIHTLSIDNPYYKKRSYVSQFGQMVEIPSAIRPAGKTIEVPCGKCVECRDMYYNSILQRAIVESLTSYMYFVTLTYDNEHLPVIDLPKVGKIYYSNYSDVQLMFKRFRAFGVLDRDFRYLCVNEYGDKFSRPHFHLLIFVARHDDDNLSTPHVIRDILFNNLGSFFARNVGSRKNPVYEKLFTYHTKITSKGLKTNYYVGYVEPTTHTSSTLSYTNDSDTFVKTIRYLIGYVNKGSRFDDTVQNYLNELTDFRLKDKLKMLLSSRVRYSKGFGFGFENGEKLYLPRISVKASWASLYYADIIGNLPDTFAEFVQRYPHTLRSFEEYLMTSKYHKFKDLSSCVDKMSADAFFNHSLLVKYFPRYIDTICKRYYRNNSISRISYFFESKDYHYRKPVIRTASPVYSFTYRYLRAGVDEALRLRLPYLGFKCFSDGKFTALCRFYKDRICTLNDTITLYRNIGVTNYDEWKALFNRQYNSYKSSKVFAHRSTHYNEEKILQNQKKYLNLPRILEGLDIYRSLL